MTTSAIIERIRQSMRWPTKAIEWSYPTSTNAERFHKPKGCYTVDLIEHEPETCPPVSLAAFDTLDAARSFAETLSEPWDTLTK